MICYCDGVEKLLNIWRFLIMVKMAYDENNLADLNVY